MTVFARSLLVAALLGATVTVAACGSPSTTADPARPTAADMQGMSGMGDMPGMAPAPSAVTVPEAAPTGTGLSASVDGYAFVATTTTLPAGTPATFRYRVTGPRGDVVTRYQPYESQLMLFDVVRADLTGYQHADPAMRQDGTWQASLAPLAPGAYRAYVTFAAPDSAEGKPLVYRLSQPFTVAGAPTPTPQAHTQDDITVTLAGHPRAGVAGPLTLGFTKQGKPIDYFQRYLDGYAHVTAVHAGDLAIAHLTPADKVPGHNLSQLSTTALFPAPGMWQVFVQYQTNGPVRTTTFTLHVA